MQSLQGGEDAMLRLDQLEALYYELQLQLYDIQAEVLRCEELLLTAQLQSLRRQMTGEHLPKYVCVQLVDYTVKLNVTQVLKDEAGDFLCLLSTNYMHYMVYSFYEEHISKTINQKWKEHIQTVFLICNFNSI